MAGKSPKWVRIIFQQAMCGYQGVNGLTNSMQSWEKTTIDRWKVFDNLKIGPQMPYLQYIYTSSNSTDCCLNSQILRFPVFVIAKSTSFPIFHAKNLSGFLSDKGHTVSRFAAPTVLLAHSQPKLFIAQLAEHFQVQRLQVTFSSFFSNGWDGCH